MRQSTAIIKRILGVSLVIACACAALYAVKRSAGAINLRQQVFGGEHVYKAFTSAQRITAQRLHLKEGSPVGSDLLDTYLQEPPLAVPSGPGNKLWILLQQPDSYDWRTDVGNSCVLKYQVLLTVQSANTTLRVALGLECASLAVYEGTNDDSKPVGWGDFAPTRHQIRAEVRRIFPNDPEIQQLR